VVDGEGARVGGLVDGFRGVSGGVAGELGEGRWGAVGWPCSEEEGG